jgi:hypothetical protein
VNKIGGPHWPIGLLELAGVAGRREDIPSVSDAGAALSPCLINTVSQSPEAIAAAAWRTWIMDEQPPPTAVPERGGGIRVHSFFAYVFPRIVPAH